MRARFRLVLVGVDWRLTSTVKFCPGQRRGRPLSNMGMLPTWKRPVRSSVPPCRTITGEVGLNGFVQPATSVEPAGRGGWPVRRGQGRDKGGAEGRLEGAAGLFGADRGETKAAPSVDLKALHAKIGELTLENDFLEGALTKAGLLSARR